MFREGCTIWFLSLTSTTHPTRISVKFHHGSTASSDKSLGRTDSWCANPCCSFIGHFFKKNSKIISRYAIVITVLFITFFWESYVSLSMALRCSFSSLPRDKLWRPRCRATQNHFLGFVWNPDRKDWSQLFERTFCSNSFLAVHHQKQKTPYMVTGSVWMFHPWLGISHQTVRKIFIKFELVLHIKYAEQAWIAWKSV